MKSNSTAIVTGASHGIGAEICKKLLLMNYEVYGFGRQFDGSDTDGLPANCHFHAIECDLLDTDLLIRNVKEIMKREPKIRVLVNNAGCAWYGLHEEMNARKLSSMVRTNLEIPMILTQLLLRRLKESEGYVINVASVTAVESAPHGAAYAASKAGLLSFSRSLFDENRKYGLKVSCIMPDLTDTNLYRNADFAPSKESGCSLSPSDVANAVEYILSQPSGVTVPEMMLRPQKNRIVRKK